LDFSGVHSLVGALGGLVEELGVNTSTWFLVCWISTFCTFLKTTVLWPLQNFGIILLMR
jgi:hypothetical protein